VQHQFQSLKKKKRNKRKKKAPIQPEFRHESRLVMMEEIKGESASKSSDDAVRFIQEEEEVFAVEEDSPANAILYRCIEKYCNDSHPLSNEEQ
jgi:hypothetical protein